MATVKMLDIEGMVDKEPMSKAERLALEFLEVFEPERPLDQEDFEEWIEIDGLSVEEVKEAAKEAVRKGWVEDTADGLRLTEFGRQKTEG
jgi:coproporphyrinogen III oxidase-like Fe-S oxidoreductase